MTSHGTIWWRASGGASAHSNFASTSRIVPHTAGCNRQARKCFADIGGRMDSKGLVDASMETAAPLGIYTRIGTKKRTSQKKSYGPLLHWASEKFPCSVCGSKMMCLCPSCVNHKTRFFDKRDLQKAREQEKRDFVREIEKILAAKILLEEALHSKQESIEYLRQNIIDRKKTIKEKRDALNIACSRYDRCRKTAEELKSRCRVHERVLSGPPSLLKISRSEYQDKVQRLVKFNVRSFFKIFRIQQVRKPEQVIDDREKRCEEAVVNACQEEFNIVTEKAWTVLPTDKYGAVSVSYYSELTPLIPEMIFGSLQLSCFESLLQICNCNAPNYSHYGVLKDWMRAGIPTAFAARPLHHMFAALVYIIELVNLLTVNFDICIPGQISFHEFSLCRNWEGGLFDTDIFKLNHAVVMLCLSLGVESSLIEPRCPFVNLLLLSNIVNGSDFVLKPAQNVLTEKLETALDEDLRKISWAERERTEDGGWCIIRRSDKFSDETYNPIPLRSVASISNLDEMLRDFSAVASPPRRLSEQDFRIVPSDTDRHTSQGFLPRIFGSFFKDFSTK